MFFLMKLYLLELKIKKIVYTYFNDFANDIFKIYKIIIKKI